VPEFNGIGASFPHNSGQYQIKTQIKTKDYRFMPAVSYAFDAPSNLGGVCPSQCRPVDLVHLANQTMGDKNLENEVLQMFARQARKALAEIAGAEPAVVAAAAHRLKGAASSVGAFKVSAAAEQLEAKADDAGFQASVGAAVVEAENFILKLCR
jgi:HPt (histidine-containing phosphotransfer) domain-containing protein